MENFNEWFEREFKEIIDITHYHINTRRQVKSHMHVAWSYQQKRIDQLEKLLRLTKESLSDCISEIKDAELYIDTSFDERQVDLCNKYFRDKELEK